MKERSNEILTSRHTLNKHIEISRNMFGDLVLFCEKCGAYTRDGSDGFCCPWARAMFWSYVHGRLRKEAA